LPPREGQNLTTFDPSLSINSSAPRRWSDKTSLGTQID